MLLQVENLINFVGLALYEVSSFSMTNPHFTSK